MNSLCGWDTIESWRCRARRRSIKRLALRKCAIPPGSNYVDRRVLHLPGVSLSLDPRLCAATPLSGS